MTEELLDADRGLAGRPRLDVVSTLKVTNALVRSMISTSSTLPTLTPATLMSSPLVTPVASLKTALYSLLSVKLRLPMVTTSRPVAIVVTTMKINSLVASAVVRLSSSFIGRSPPFRG
jgi:hypothetical protein